MQGLLKRKQSIEEEWYFKCRCSYTAKEPKEMRLQVSKMLRCDRVWNIFFCHEMLTLPRRPYFTRNSSRRWDQSQTASDKYQSIQLTNMFEFLNLLVPFRFFVALQILFKSLWGSFHRRFGKEHWSESDEKMPQVCQLEDELHSLIRNTKTTVTIKYLLEALFGSLTVVFDPLSFQS